MRALAFLISHVVAETGRHTGKYAATRGLLETSIEQPGLALLGPRRTDPCQLSRLCNLSPWRPVMRRWVPRLVKPLSIGTVSLDSLAESSIPQSSYVSPADRYAVVPDQNPADHRNGDMGMVRTQAFLTSAQAAMLGIEHRKH